MLSYILDFVHSHRRCRDIPRAHTALPINVSFCEKEKRKSYGPKNHITVGKKEIYFYDFNQG